MIGGGSLRACRIAFVVAILMPTLAGSAGLLTWGMWSRPKPPPAEAWPSMLESLWGGVIRVDRIEPQGPQQATLVGVTLVDPTTGATRAWLPQVVACRTGGAWALSTDLLILDCEQLLATAEDCLALRHAITPSRVLPPSDWELMAHRVVLQAGPFQQTFQQAAISVARKTDNQPEARLKVVAFAAEQDLAEPPLRLEWERRHDEGGFSSAGRLTTGAASVACRAIASLCPWARRLGTACEFHGDWAWSQVGPERKDDFTGELVNVDLDALISEQFPHRLSGIARVQIERATLQQGRLSALKGAIAAEGGVLSASLLGAAAEHLKLASPQALIESPPAAAIPFERLYVSFDLKGAQLALRGHADPNDSGVLLAAAGRPLLAAPADHGVPAVALLRLLVPPAEYQVPATRQTATLVRLLPVPDAPATQAGRHTPTRLAPAAAVETTATPPVRAPGLR